MASKPYYTSRSFIDAVKRKIMFPINQATFTDDDILSFANEEMMISQVPAVMQFHEEYFVTYSLVPLEYNKSRYPIPKRAIGMKLRDLNYVDSQYNMYEMSRIDAADAAFFQQTNTSSSPYANRFYMQGNDVVMSPGVTVNPSGSLRFSYYLRPNQLVVDEKSATISGFENKITVDNDFVDDQDTFSFGGITYTAVTSAGSTISSISAESSTTITTTAAHKLTTGQTVVITGSNSLPSIDGTYTVTVINSTSFTIPKKVGTAGSAGSITCKNHFLKGASSVLTATNLAASMTSVGNVLSASNGTPATAVVTFSFSDVTAEFSTTQDLAFGFDSTVFGVQFESLPTTYTDPLTNVSESLFTVGSLVDFLQTDPGHRTYTFDVEIKSISGNTAYFSKSDLEVYTDVLGNKSIIKAGIGDYICRANECIIPQIPPELHTGLAERTAARILSALGDKDGLAVQNAKISDIERREGNLIDDRTEGATKKVLNKHSHLRMFKSGRRRTVF